MGIFRNSIPENCFCIYDPTLKIERRSRISTAREVHDQRMKNYTGRDFTYLIHDDNCTSSFKTEEERDADLQKRLSSPKCRICGDFTRGSYDRPKDPADLCFMCNFWQEKVDLAAAGNSIRIQGSHYELGPETNHSAGCRGFGGRTFKIKMLNGMKITTSNLWTQGLIPPQFKNLLPDNAEWDRQ